jgi:hypothetical protein
MERPPLDGDGKAAASNAKLRIVAMARMKGYSDRLELGTMSYEVFSCWARCLRVVYWMAERRHVSSAECPLHLMGPHRHVPTQHKTASSVIASVSRAKYPQLGDGGREV